MSNTSTSGPGAGPQAIPEANHASETDQNAAPMTAEAVLEALTYVPQGTSPRLALEAALGMREALTPHLVRALSLAPLEVQALSDENPDKDRLYFLHEAAMYLLATWGEPQGWRLILDFFVSDDDVAMELMSLGTEVDLPAMLVRCYDGSDPAYLERIIATGALDPLFRQACLQAYHGLVLLGRLPYPRLVAFVAGQLDAPADAKPGDWYDWLAYRAARLQEPALRAAIEALLDRGLTVYGDSHLALVNRDGLDRIYADDSEAIKAEILQDGVFADLPATLSKWSWFQSEEPDTCADRSLGADDFEMPQLPVVRAHRNLGRNDPCHCGSGKKYKKCCLDDDRSMPA